MKKNFVDIHCHYFNGKFAFRELLEIAWRSLKGNYPYNRHEQNMRLKSFSPFSTLETIIEYAASLLSALGANADWQYKHEQNAFKESKLNQNHSLPIITSPLMMDIYFAVDKGKYLEEIKEMKSLPKDMYSQMITPLDISKDEQEEFKSLAEELKNDVLSAVRKKQTVSEMQHKGIDTGLKDIELLLDNVIAEFEYPNEDERTVNKKTELVQLTRGFRKQLKEIQNLKSKYSETLFPFFAVDPRRVGIADLLEENLRNGTFAGVKLYPPLGYFPTHPDLYPIYDLCLKYNVPITAHCSPGGFHTRQKIMKTESLDPNGDRIIEEVIVAKGNDLSKCSDPECIYFADPDNWIEILENEKYKDLRINLAHFGGDKQFERYIKEEAEKENWTAKIIRLIEQYDNVYTDLSYHIDKDISKNIKKLISEHSFLEDRLMFGTDFIMISLNYKLTNEKKKALVDYFDHFEGLPEPLFSTNALRFLGKLDTD